MRFHQVEGGEVADALVQRGRALEVGEQEGHPGDLEPLVDVDNSEKGRLRSSKSERTTTCR